MRVDHPFLCYLIADPSACKQWAIEQVVEQAVEGGVTAVQLRSKHVSDQEMVQMGERIQNVLGGRDIPFIINDRVDVAIALNAEGVHLGQEDVSYLEARALLGPDKIIGLSVSTIEEAFEAEEWKVDYLGVGSVFSTNTKYDIFSTLGIAMLEQIVRVSNHLLCAIGGINMRNIYDVLETGVDGVAIASMICGANDPLKASKRLINSIAQRRESKNDS